MPVAPESGSVTPRTPVRVPAVVTVHVWRVPGRRVPTALTRMATDRARLRKVRGLRFARLLGTGRGSTFAIRDADLHRWALLASWGSEDDATEFEKAPTVRGWNRLAEERWRVELTPLASHGRWGGREPFGAPSPRRWDGPVASLTRARISARKAVTFWRAVPPVASALSEYRNNGGLLAAFGVGEAPAGWQGTLSVWRTAEDLRAFAYQGAAHSAAIRRTKETGWYAEELFARFGVVRADGSLDGRDPLR
ncbi:monooxygenase [Cryptosporangium sp. NPDC051539]|uniref:monooxygenase n=1 Tax=Cryptosporangium sp. NPDC051539 TaxID=3363962 RepID=UPI0037B1CEA3